MAIESMIDFDQWQAERFEPLAQRACIAVLRTKGLAQDDCEIGILATSDKRIATLNAEFRGKPVPTNVLSWPAQDLAALSPGEAPRKPVPDPTGEYVLGDIAIAYETCMREASDAGKPLADHVTHLIVHGMLHLLGYDHENDADAALMEGLEVEILGRLGLDSPYREDNRV